ncbi:MAG TPA: S1 RNA-binding domain-containing protein, partial [Methylococcaceae bacterium]|nr:S1 RNA-binding domain-containing protein [Methylococcaceae bacterium]
MSESFAELFEESLAKTEMRIGSMLMGTVVEIDSDKVIVNAGLKSEGVIPKWQFLNADGELEVEVGDEIEVALDLIEDGLGATLLSRDKAKRNKAWSELEKAFESNETITGRINGRVRGGLTVAIGALQGFLPGSLVDVRPIRDTSFLEGHDLEFKIIKIDQKRNNVVVSRRAVVELEYSAEREELLNSLKEGIVLPGIVKNLTDYGAFIDLGGVDGLLHITDMAWRRIRHPSECVEIGEEIQVK